MISLRTLPLLALAASIALAPRVARGEDAKAAAHDHFDRGLAASQEQRFDDAAREFEAAYALTPDFKVLYNIGRVSVLLGRPVRAIEALESYLAEGGDQLSEERRDEVRRLIDGQFPKVATLGVQTAPGADVRVDGQLVGHAPLAGRVRVTAGAHTVEALLPGRPPQLREVTLEGASTTDLSLIFPPAPPPATRPSDLATTPGVAPAPPRRRRVAGYVTGGIGLLAIVGGAALAFESALDANDARGRLIAATTPATPTPADVVKYDAAKVTYDDARTRNQLGWAIAGVGGLAVLTAAVLVYTSPAETSAATSHAQLVAGPGAIALRATW